MYNKNNKGPRMDPWGMPHLIVLESERIPLTIVFCVRCDK